MGQPSVGQKPLGQQPVFDVASVKINHLGENGGYRDTSRAGVVEFTNSTLQTCIRWAYDVRDFQIVGAPSWLNSDRYDIHAKAPPTTSDQQLRVMVQALLAERFGLKVHRDTKELPTYSLVALKGVSKGGSKLKKTTSGVSTLSAGPDRITDRAVTMATFASQLSTVLARVVVDKTGLTDRYDIKLEWVLELEAATGDGPSVLTAIQDQLGLKLEAGKGQVEVIVIDHVERVPTEN
jgi:uncharacterized protein (TIGR03435 family)